VVNTGPRGPSLRRVVYFSECSAGLYARECFVRPLKKIHLDSSLYKIPGWVYFVTIVSNFKTPYFLKERFNNEIIDCLKEEREKMRCKIYAYCLMPDHLHFLCGTKGGEISVLDFVSQFKGKSTRIGWRYNIKGPLWQRRSYDHIVREEEDLQETAKYIVNNPVRSGVVEKWDQYPFCGFLDEFDV
jgi:REP element-mobilizing transposase RayT